MTLLERCIALQSDRKKIDRLKKNTQETSSLRTKFTELQTVVEPLPTILKSFRDYRNENLPLQPIDISSVHAVSKFVMNIKGRFAETPKHESLVYGQDWPQLIAGIKAISTEIRTICKQGWSVFTEEYFSGHSQELIEANYVKTQKNELLLAEYKKLTRELKALASTSGNVESIQDFKKNGARLKEIAKILLDFKAPDNVKKFLAAVSGGGAGLGLLTEDVVEWLKSEGFYSKFKIVGGS